MPKVKVPNNVLDNYNFSLSNIQNNIDTHRPGDLGGAPVWDDPTSNFFEQGNMDNENGGYLGRLDDAIGKIFFGDADASTSLWNDITGQTAQDKEMAWEYFKMKYENWYDDPRNETARRRAAGENPASIGGNLGQNTSATGSGAPAPSSAAAEGLSSVAGAISSLGKLGSEVSLNEANASKAIADAETADATREALLDQIVASTGLSRNQADLFFEQAQVIWPESQARINNFNAQKNLAIKEVEVYNKTIDKMQKEIDKIDKDMNLEDYLIEQEKLNKYILEWRTNFMKNHGLDPTSSLEQMYCTIYLDKGIIAAADFEFAMYRAYHGSNQAAQDAIEGRELTVNAANVENALKTAFPGMSEDERKQFLETYKLIIPLLNIASK